MFVNKETTYYYLLLTERAIRLRGVAKRIPEIRPSPRSSGSPPKATYPGIGTYQLVNLMIYVPAEVMPASLLCETKTKIESKLKRQRKRKCQRRTKTKMILKTKKHWSDDVQPDDQDMSDLLSIFLPLFSPQKIIIIYQQLKKYSKMKTVRNCAVSLLLRKWSNIN